MKAPAEMTTREKVRDALWRYAPERTERLATVTTVAGFTLATLAAWVLRGRERESTR